LAALIKSPEWSYEKEWRTIAYTERKPDLSIEKVQAQPVSAIYLGAEAETDNEMIEICKERKIPVYKMSLSNEDFSLKQKDCDLYVLCITNI